MSKAANKRANESAPVKGVEHGTYIGPTGRKRALYGVIAYNRQRERRGSEAGYGYQGMKEAKKAIARREEKYYHHRVWLRYDVVKRKV